MKESDRVLAMEWWNNLGRAELYKFSGSRLPMELGIPEITEIYLKTKNL